MIKENYKIYIFSPILHQYFYQKLTKYVSNFIPINIIPNILHEEDVDEIINEIVNDKNIEKSDCEMETFGSIEEIKYPQECNSDQPIVIILDDLNQKMDDSRVQTMFKRRRHNHISVFIISQYYFELSKTIIRANGNVDHIFKLNNYRKIQNICRDKAGMDTSPHE